MKEAYLYKKLTKKRVQCQNCSHYCLLEPGQRGICLVRENIEGRLYALNYEKLIACHIDPIEKKPFFHFLPGSYSLSIATVGCNFSCLWCQNWDISQGPKFDKEILGRKISPKEIVKMAKKEKLPSISYTYTEPTIFSEYALDIMKLAKREGLKNNWVTNGFWSKELFDLIWPYLDAANVDLKGWSEEFYQKYCGGRLQPVLENLILLKKKKIWVEVTTLIIPTLNDKEEWFEEMAKFIKEKMGPETPWHLTQFCGRVSWQMQHLPDTPVETLQKAWQIGKRVGLKYVYTGNLPGLPSEDTFCPKCGSLVIDRTNYFIHRYDKEGKCPNCKTDLNLILE